MKKVAFPIVALVLTFAFFACKNETKSETEALPEDLAVAEASEETSPEYLYVTASSGLTLRQHNNLNSEKLAVMPYGTKVKIISEEKETTMTVGGIKGGMHEVEYNQHSGYAFNGYLSRFFPPDEDMKPKAYAEALKEQFPKVSFSETTGGTASNPSNTASLLLPTTQWHEAFYIAKQLFEIPTEFAFPEPKGSNEEVVKETKPKSGVWTSQLLVNRENDQLEKIIYSYRTEGFRYTVTISQEGDAMKLERTDVAD
ncbi:SH3 domain-containing protein [Altibacter sp.]|uniref:SH3 domain-containing protein n=1 Tax=Altibacter sp. TaxID=2024823 RepID=UPI00258FBF8B|nr:SH3 domain-containing protein [Altibacter sp.]MCW9036815.1 SH3 domain-containing protein [Altibacter sp.]